MDTPTVWVVDDDLEMRKSLVWLLQTAHIPAISYGTSQAFLEEYNPRVPGALLLDLMLAECTGLDLLARVRELGGQHPFVMISGQADVAYAVEAGHQGAVDFLEKPFDNERLLTAIRKSLDMDRNARERARRFEKVEQRLATLTPREHEVMLLVVEGMLTKQIARRLEISEKTVEVHRSHITKKMSVASVAQLVRMITEHSLAKRAGEQGTSEPPTN